MREWDRTHTMRCCYMQGKRTNLLCISSTRKQMKENGRRSGNNVRNKRAEERRETDGRENRHDCFVLRSPIHSGGIRNTVFC
jgi:hypothetical protein